MTNELAMTVLQVFAGIILLITTSIAGWTLIQVVKLKTDVARLQAENEDTDRRFGELRDWLKGITAQLDRLVCGLLKE